MRIVSSSVAPRNVARKPRGDRTKPTRSVLSTTDRPDRKCPASAANGANRNASNSRNRMENRTISHRLRQYMAAAAR
jgi:hypothetical protein